MASSFKINELIKKSSHYDADERYMAISDLTEELGKYDGKIESSLQVKSEGGKEPCEKGGL